MEPAAQRAPIETDDVVVLVVGSPGGKFERGYLEGVTRLEKLVFLLERETPVREWVTEAADFRAHRFGPFSSRIYQAVDKLASAGLIRDSAVTADNSEDNWESVNVVGGDAQPYTNRTFRLTEDGSAYYMAVLADLPSQAESVLEKFKDRFGGLPLRQLVRYVYERYPEYTVKSEIRDDILGR